MYASDPAFKVLLSTTSTSYCSLLFTREHFWPAAVVAVEVLKATRSQAETKSLLLCRALNIIFLQRYTSFQALYDSAMTDIDPNQPCSSSSIQWGFEPKTTVPTTTSSFANRPSTSSSSIDAAIESTVVEGRTLCAPRATEPSDPDTGNEYGLNLIWVISLVIAK